MGEGAKKVEGRGRKGRSEQQVRRKSKGSESDGQKSDEGELCRKGVIIII